MGARASDSELENARQRILELERRLAAAERSIAELRKTDAQLKATIESIPFQFFALDTEGTYVLQNSALRDAWGSSIGKRPQDLGADPQTVALWLDNNRRAMAGETVDGEVSWEIAGRTRYFRNIVSPVQIDGKTVGILGINIDITDQKLAEAALRNSELKFRAIAENVPGVVFAYDQVDGSRRDLIFAGPGVETLIGPELAAKVGDNVDALMELIHPEDREHVIKAGEGEEAIGRPVDIEYRILISDDDFRWIRSISRPLELPGNVRRWHGVLIDVTDRVKAKEALFQAKELLEQRVRERTADLEELNRRLKDEIDSHKATTVALQESESAIRALMNATSESIIMVDLDATILAINEAGARRLGSTPEGLIGKDAKTIMDVDAVNSRMEAGLEVIRSAEPVHRTHEREGRIYDSWYYPVFDAGGEIKGLAVFARDITEQEEFEKELRRVNTELEAERHMLERKNIALKELVRSVEEQINGIKRQVQSNVNRSILPLLSQIAMRLPDGLEDLVSLLKRSLEEISGSFSASLESKYPQLTPREIDVCRMIRGGMHTKEIAGLLNLSDRTVEKFRQSIRRKLGLKGEKQNMQTFLQSL